MAVATITVEPWPQYADHGGPPTWNVRIEGRRCATLQWSVRLGRFRKSTDARYFRRSDPSNYRNAVASMEEFCSKSGQQVGVAS